MAARWAELRARWARRIPPVPTSWLRRLAIATLLANVFIVLSGGAVRLTDSGLGCPTWPTCTATSLTPHDALSIHPYIEFGNRLVTIALVIVCAATWLAMLWSVRPRRSLVWLSGVILLGVPAQAVMGGITVLTDLNPWIVSAHFMLSMGLVALSTLLVRRVGEGDGSPQPLVPPPIRGLAWAGLAALAAVLYVGTVVTGSGPHAGNAEAPRTGLNPEQMSQLHADLVFLLVGVTVGLLFALHGSAPGRRAYRAAWALLAVEVGQGAVGFVQYFLGLPTAVVGLHLFGACVVTAAATWLVLLTRERPVARPADERPVGRITPTRPEPARSGR